MNGRDRFSKIVSLSFCVILLLSLAEFPEKESFGLHRDSVRKRIFLSESDVDPDHIRLSGFDPATIRNPLDEKPCIATGAMHPGLSPRRFGPMYAGSFSLPPDEAGPGSSTVLRV